MMSRDELIKAVQAITVVRIRAKRDGSVVQACDLYVGRACYREPWRQPASEFANPFSTKKYGREDSTARYEQYLRETTELYEKLDLIATMALERYRAGLEMRLGCWCAPEPCHADIIVKLMKEKLRI